MMNSINISAQVTVKYCSECDGYTAYHCLTCERELCPPCKRIHTTERHHVLLYKKKNGSLLNEESCIQHPEQIYKTFCETCDCPVCPHCKEHNEHSLENIETAYGKKKKLEEDIIRISSNMLNNAPVLASRLRNNVSTLREEMFHIHSIIVKKSQGLKEYLDAIASVKKEDLWSSIYQQNIQIYMHVAKVEKLLHVRGYTQAANKPVQFLKFIRKKRLSEILNSLYISRQAIGMNDLIKLLTTMSMYFPISQKPVKVACIGNCDHMSYVPPDLVWISNMNSKLQLIDLETGGKLYTVHEARDPLTIFPFFPSLLQTGCHAVNSQRELFYIDELENVIKLSANQKQTTLVLQKISSKSKVQCLYCSPFSDDLLIGIAEESVAIVRCDKTFKQIQFIYQGDLICNPCYISENTNGDIVVSDFFGIIKGMGAIVVIDCKGNHRFSYSQSPSGSKILPAGICTDAMSHILLCDMYTNTVQILSKNGFFWLYLLPEKGVYRPTTLCYDFNTHLLLVGSQFSEVTRVSVFRYTNKLLSLAGK